MDGTLDSMRKKPVVTNSAATTNSTTTSTATSTSTDNSPPTDKSKPTADTMPTTTPTTPTQPTTPTPTTDTDVPVENTPDCMYCKASALASIAFKWGLVLLVVAASYHFFKTSN